MSLYINPGKVTAVLLADGWHDVADDSFDLDAYEYVEPHPDPGRDGLILLGGGQCAGVPSTGFVFAEVGGGYLFGPLTSIVAVRTAKR